MTRLRPRNLHQVKAKERRLRSRVIPILYVHSKALGELQDKTASLSYVASVASLPHYRLTISILLACFEE
jgi:hypothetical protein